MANKFELYYGKPGSAKTRSIIELIKKVNQETGKVARVYTGDGSKIMYSMSNLYKNGIVKVMDFSIRDQPFTCCQQITEGFWPENVDDPQSKMKRLTPAEVAETGMWVIEGAAVMGVYMMGDAKGGLAQRAADGEIIGQDTNVRITDPSNKEYNFGGNSGGHYNIAQRHLHADIIRSKAFPGEYVIWTTHERMDDGERGGAFVKGATADKIKLNDKMIGPELVGKALTSNISRDFGNTLHFEIATKKVTDGTDPVSGKTLYKDKADYRIYTRDHYDPDGIVGLKYMAINRAINPLLIADYYSSDQPGEGLVNFYNDLDKASQDL